MQLTASALLSAAVVGIFLVETYGRPSDPQPQELRPLRREARENSGFYTAHQDAGISKYSQLEVSPQTSGSNAAHLEEYFPSNYEHKSTVKELEATTENVLNSTINQTSSGQQEDYIDDNNPTEYVTIATQIPHNDTEDMSESQNTEYPQIFFIPEHTTDLSTQPQAAEVGRDTYEVFNESQTNDNPSLSSESDVSHSDFKTMTESENYRASEKDDFEIAPTERSYNSDEEPSISLNDNTNFLSVTQKQYLVQTPENAKPSPKSDLETVVPPQEYNTNQQHQHANNDHNKVKEPNMKAKILAEHLDFKLYNNHNADKRRIISLLFPDNDYSSRNPPVYNSVSGSSANLNQFFQPTPAPPPLKYSYADKEVRKEDGGEIQYLTKFRDSKSFPYTPSAYSLLPEEPTSPSQSQFIGRSQVPSLNQYSSHHHSPIQTPYSMTYRVNNIKNVQPSVAGGARARQYYWPFADYFPIVINDPFLAAYNAFYNVFEYGPEADICGRLLALRNNPARDALAAHNAALYRINPLVTSSVRSDYVPAATEITLANAHVKPISAADPHSVHSTVSSPQAGTGSESGEEEQTVDDMKPTVIIMSTNDTTRNATFITKLVVRKGGVSIAGPGGIATAGSGGLAIVGPGGVAYTSPNGMAIVGPGGKVVALPSGAEVVFNPQDFSAKRYLASLPPGGKVVAEGPTIYYHPPQ
ncbi:uncharacterized protein LOC134529853 isoform X2 [Bacillus rossius redtenbacheri]|uniref:uncharacterized protein LOC134529853 isoform X2 n=1 Tax=Bacillus rossius redtenbacheri TaxID=93214 RepID=UPI002FDD3583